MSAPQKIALLAFYRKEMDAPALDAAGVDGYIIDWEAKNKQLRQEGYNTEINLHSPADIRTLRALTSQPIICRINGPGHYSPEEVEAAITAGADELLLPMVRTEAEVEALLKLIDGRCQLAIMVETTAAVESRYSLSQLPISRIYVGLNDLCIDRRSHNLFEPLLDGTIARLREAFTQPIGYAGLTHAQAGRPIPCKLLIYHMQQHGCGFTFLRRSFYKDLQTYSPSQITQSIEDSLAQMAVFSPSQQELYETELKQHILAYQTL